MKKSGLGEIEAHNLAEPGDVLVIQGIASMSSMGGVSASVGKRQGEAGAIVDGAVRDIDHSRKIGYPVWCSSVSPVTGKWRIQTVAINRPVSIAGVTVRPGDLVIADEVGVCFVPFERAAEVLAVAQRLAKREEDRLAKLDAELPLKDWIKLWKDTLRTLMRYKAWANELVFAAAAKLPEAELTAPRKIVFGNLVRTLNHVYAMDEVWRAHLEGRPHGYSTRNPDACPSLVQLREAQPRRTAGASTMPIRLSLEGRKSSTSSSSAEARDR